MAGNWEIRPLDGEAPQYLPTSEYFTIQMYYGIGDIDNCSEYRFAGFVDFCAVDYISRLELISMAKEMNLNVEGCSFWWKDTKSEMLGMSEIKNDLDAVAMALVVDHGSVTNVYVKVTRVDVSGSDDVPIVAGGSGGGVGQGEVASKGKEVDEESELNDSDYSLQSDREEEEDAVDANEVCMPEIDASGEIRGGENFDADEVESEYAVSEELQSCSSTDEDEIDPARPKYSEFHEEIDKKDPHFKIGMKFRSFKQFKEAVKNYGIKNRCVMNFKPNNKRRCKAFCRKGCPFYLWASPMVKDRSTIQIKAGNLKHECSRDHNIRHVNAQWIAEHYLEQFRADPSWKIAGVIQAVKSNQEVDISRLKAWRAKCIATRMLDGDEHTQMTRLYDYRLELIRTHPGSTVKFRCNQGVFEAMYVCLSPLREGFLAGCRPIISLDGCFLKGLYGGQLLSAVGIDANDCIYPIVWAVVSRENHENWVWFLELLAVDLEINNSYGWAFMSDRQKGLLPAIQHLFPNSEHRFCVRHIHTNFRKRFRGKALKDQMWACARSTYIPAFNEAMDVLKDMSPEAYGFMKNIDPHHWSRSHFKTDFKCDMLLNNLCECFNSMILQARTKGIISMNEMIRTQLMVRIKKKRDSMQRCATQHCTKILKKLEKSKQLSWSCKTIWSGGDKYQVVGLDGQFIVDKDERTCTCRRWQVTGIPCCHAISALYYNKHKPEDYLDDCYKTSTFLATYTHILHPTQGSNCWPRSNQPPMIPPEPINKNRGRKQLLRRKDASEESTGFTKGKVSRKGVTITCSICSASGHNKRYHGLQGKNQGASGVQDGQSTAAANTNEGASNEQDPLTTIDPQVLEEHFQEADRMRIENENEDTVVNENMSAEAISQVVNTPGQTLPGSSTAEDASLRMQNMTRRRGTKLGLRKSQARKQFPPRPPVLRNQVFERDAEDGSTLGGVKKKKKAWIPPGLGGGGGPAAAHGRSS